MRRRPGCWRDSTTRAIRTRADLPAGQQHAVILGLYPHRRRRPCHHAGLDIGLSHGCRPARCRAHGAARPWPRPAAQRPRLGGARPRPAPGPAATRAARSRHRPDHRAAPRLPGGAADRRAGSESRAGCSTQSRRRVRVSAGRVRTRHRGGRSPAVRGRRTGCSIRGRRLRHIRASSARCRGRCRPAGGRTGPRCRGRRCPGRHSA